MIPNEIEILLPWKPLNRVDVGARALQLSAELKREVSAQHPLHGLDAKALAVRIDRDDVLFWIERDSDPLAVVHLSWKHEPDARWPSTTLFSSWERWVQEEMIPAHNEYIL